MKYKFIIICQLIISKNIRKKAQTLKQFKIKIFLYCNLPYKLTRKIINDAHFKPIWPFLGVFIKWSFGYWIRSILYQNIKHERQKIVQIMINPSSLNNIKNSFVSYQNVYYHCAMYERYFWSLITVELEQLKSGTAPFLIISVKNW